MEKLIIIAVKDGVETQFPVEVKHLSRELTLQININALRLQGYEIKNHLVTGRPNRNHRRGISRTLLHR